MEAVISEIPSAVTLHPIAFGVEHDKTVLCLLRDCLLVTVNPVIERRATGYYRALVDGDRLCNTVWRHCLAGERRLEQRAVSLNGVQLLKQLLDGHVHFNICLHRSKRLRLQRRSTTVPHEDFAKSRVDDCRGAAAEFFHAVSDAGRLTVAPPIGGTVAGRTRQ